MYEYVVAALCGVLVAVQPQSIALFGQLTKAPSFAVLVSLIMALLGGLVFFIVQTVRGVESFDWDGMKKVPWWAWLGGLYGTVYIAVITLFTPRMGTMVLISVVIVTELVVAAILDHFGWLGLLARPMDAWRSVGLLLMICGVVVMSQSVSQS